MDKKYVAVIGLEIHAELKTRTKMFCESLNNPDEKKPNTNICPVCLGHPGTLPVINKEAVLKALSVGAALSGKLAEYSRFDRKSYFYPDLPKGYQISQYKYPLVAGGALNDVNIRRVHLEEDTGRLFHGDKNDSLVDYNRAGIPLMELVTEPDIKSGEEAKNFAEELQIILRYLEASSADMEKGEMRVEANVSVAPKPRNDADSTRKVAESDSVKSASSLRDSAIPLGIKVEIKNLNSFRAVQRAVEFETERQIKLLDEGKSVTHETRGWDETKQKTFSQRGKEEAHDYRYLPEPDLPPLRVSELLGQLPGKIELPKEKRIRYKEEYAMDSQTIETIVRDKEAMIFFESAAKSTKKENMVLASNYIASDLFGILKNLGTFSWERINAKHFSKLIEMLAEDKVSSRTAKDILPKMIQRGKDPTLMIREEGLSLENNEEKIRLLMKQIISKNPKAILGIKSGKKNATQFLIGKAMQASKGTLNPKIVKNIINEMLE